MPRRNQKKIKKLVLRNENYYVKYSEEDGIEYVKNLNDAKIYNHSRRHELLKLCIELNLARAKVFGTRSTSDTEEIYIERFMVDDLGPENI